MSLVLEVWKADRSAKVGEIDEPHDGWSWSDTLDGSGGGQIVVDSDHADAALLTSGRLVVVRDTAFASGDPDGELAAWTVQGYGAKIGDAWIPDAISGPTVYALLADSCVEPEYGLARATITQRVFGAQAAAYDDSAWPAAVSHGSQASSALQAGAPEDWPDPDAERIWSTVDDPAPEGYVYLRRTITFSATDTLEARLFVTADDTAEVWHNGAPVISVTDLYGWARTYDVDLTLTPGVHTFYVRGYNRPDPDGVAIGRGPGHLTLSLMTLDADGNPDTVLLRSDGDWKALGYPASPPGMTRGEILDVCLTEAQARGELAGFTWDFTGALDSTGAADTEELEVAFQHGANLAQVAGELAELGYEVAVTPALVVRGFLGRRGVDRSGSVNLVTAVGALLGEPQMVRISRPKTRLFIQTPGGYAETEDAAGVAVHGVRTMFVSLGGIATTEAAVDYIAGVLAEVAGDKLDTSVVIDPDVVGPYVDAGGSFDLGDDITVPAHRTPAGLAMRVLAIGGKVDAAGIVTYNVDAGA